MPDTRRYVFTNFKEGQEMVTHSYDLSYNVLETVRDSRSRFTGQPPIPGATALKDLRFVTNGSYGGISSLSTTHRAGLKELGIICVADLSKITLKDLKSLGGFGARTVLHLRNAGAAAGTAMAGSGWPGEVTVCVPIKTEAVVMARIMCGGNEDQAKEIVQAAAAALMAGVGGLGIENIKDGLEKVKQSELQTAQKQVAKIREALRALNKPGDKKGKKQ